MHRPTQILVALGVALALAACGSPSEQEPTAGPADVVDGTNLTDITETEQYIDIETEETAGTTQLTPEEQAEVHLIDAGDRVYFDYDKSAIGVEGEATLRAQGELLLGASGLTVTIEGHCDERGTREYNIALGERRAEAVKTYLVSLGVEANRISTLSYGKERPEVAGHNEDAWRQNRVAVTVINP
ncbi:MAG: peptidoglycan-associated lipoprotein Pal [Alphaproteobacteria bacterium]|nr:peptidoglycan-associated lipoprotein Pal [Alphaproteobacteria bacterium]